jgi:Do/DeqQ family serine protease
MKFKQIVTTVLISVVTAAASIFVYGRYIQEKRPIVVQNESGIPVNYARYMPGTEGNANATPPSDFTIAAKAAVPGVVHIKTKINPRQINSNNRQRSILQDLFGDEFFGDEFNGGGGGRRYYIPGQMASGSGVLISQDGYIVTNNHVVADADEITVALSSGNKVYKAKLIGADPSTDLAVIKIDATNMPYLVYGNSDNVDIGQWVLAVGYPLNLDATVTAGIVSAKSRSIGINKSSSGRVNTAIESFIQTDAAVNQGNSGGALVNTAGELVGINSAIASPTGSYAGYSYAIPVNLVKKVVNDIVKYGNVQRAYLGVRYAPNSVIANMSDEQLKEAGIRRDVPGVQVTDVMPNSSAAAAGIKAGDVITAVNGVKIPTTAQLGEQVARYKPGDKISLTYIRDNKEYTVNNVIMRNLKGNTDLVKLTTIDRLGADLSDLSKEQSARLGINGGVLVNDIGNGILKKQTSMMPGFVILKAGSATVANVDDLSSALEKQKSLRLTGFYPERGADIYYYNINTGSGATENL